MTRARVRISAKSPFPRSLSAPSVTATVAAGTASASFITLSTLGGMPRIQLAFNKVFDELLN